MNQSTKIINCEKCGNPMRIDKDSEIGVCWRCTSKEILERADEMPTAEPKKRGRKKKEKLPGSTSTKNHMSPEAIRERFDGPAKREKMGFFQEIFSIIKKNKNISLSELAKAGFSLKSKPPRYNSVERVEAQIRNYCSDIWGKKSGLVKISDSNIIYNGREK